MIRTIIVDDEILARIGMQTFIDGRENIVVSGIFGSGEEALEYVERNEVDVVVTDIEMAGLSGLDFIRALREGGFEGGIVITSCHDEFSYAQDAIRQGTDSYLLKINLDQDKLIEEIKRVYEQRSRMHPKGLRKGEPCGEGNDGEAALGIPVSRDGSRAGRAKKGMPQGSQRKKETAENPAAESGMQPGKGFYQVAIICLNQPSQAASLPGASGGTQEGWNLQHEDSLIINLLEEIVNHYHMGTLFTPYNRESFLLLTYGEGSTPEEIASIRKQNMDIISKNVLQYLNEQVFIGLSSVYRDLKETRAKFDEAVCASEMKFFGTGAVCASFDELDFACTLPEIRCDLQSFLADTNRLVGEIGEICARAKEAGMPRRQFQSQMSRIMNNLSYRFVKDAFFREHLVGSWEQEIRCDEFLNEAHTIREFQEKMESAIHRFAEKVSGSQTNEVINQVLRYIDKNLEKELTLPELAACAGMSVPSFCRHFKECIGSTTTQYINEQRIRKAETMLATGSYTVAEIASACGFSNDNYFVRVFKKITGMTISEFRDTKMNES